MTTSHRKSSRCKPWPWHGFTGQKVCFPRFYSLLFIHETEKKKGGRDSERGKEREESPSASPLMLKTKISFLICPLMEYTWCVLSLYICFPAVELFFLCVFTCLHCLMHTSVCVCEGELEWGTDKENISNRSMLFFNWASWEVIIP